MDKIALSILPPPCNDELDAVDCIACPKNLIETELIILILKKAVDPFFDRSLETAENLLTIANKILEEDDEKSMEKGLHYLNKIIYRTPANNSVFLDALLARILSSFRSKKFPLCRNDLQYYKSFDAKLMTVAGLLLVQTLLCYVLYLMREMYDAKITLQELEEVLDEMPMNILLENRELLTLLEHLEKYKPEIKESIKIVKFKIKEKDHDHIPLNGYKCDDKIPNASKSCDFISDPKSGDGVYAQTEIPKGTIVVSENSEYFQYSTPFMNCELCGTHQSQMYTCENCLYKTYCSLACIKSDCHEHKYECYGYKIGLIPMLNATLLFKVFLNAAKYLSLPMSDFISKLGPIKDAASAWSFIVSYTNIHKSHNSIIREFLSKETNYEKLTIIKWSQLITSAYRLAVFVHNDTNIMEHYFNQLKLPKSESIKLIFAILMRLNLHIALHSQRTDLQYPNAVPAYNCNNWQYEESLVPFMNKNAFEYYSITAHEDFIECFKEIQERALLTKDSEKQEHNDDNVPLNTTREGPMSEYVNKILNVCLKDEEISSADELLDVKVPSSAYFEQCLQKLNTSKRCKLLSSVAKYFHTFLYDYFCHKTFRRQEKIALCVTLKNFNHSCAPNVEIKLLDSGLYVGISTRNVKANGELTVSHYSVNHLTHNRNVRLAIFEGLGLTCRCIACITPLLFEPINARQGLFCAFCENDVEITEATGECSECHMNYAELSSQYKAFISCIEGEILDLQANPAANQRKLAVLYGTYNNYVSMHFVKGHEVHLSAVLNFAEFLAMKGFLNHATDIIFALFNSDYSFIEHPHIYKEFDFKIFNVIQKIIESFIQNSLTSSFREIDPMYPRTLLVIALHILKTQEGYVHPSLDDIESYNIFLENYTQYNKWKKVINSSIMMPLSLQEHLSSN